MTVHQTMSARLAQEHIDKHAQKFGALILNEEWDLEHAHSVLAEPDKNGLDLFAIAGLAKAIACFQCDGDLVKTNYSEMKK